MIINNSNQSWPRAPLLGGRRRWLEPSSAANWEVLKGPPLRVNFEKAD